MNQELSLANTELAEDNIENVFDVNTAEQPAQGKVSGAQILRREFLSLLHRLNAAMQRSRGIHQQRALALPCDEGTLVRAQRVLGECNDPGQQVADAIASARRNVKTSRTRFGSENADRVRSRRASLLLHQVDLVPNPPDGRLTIIRLGFVLRVAHPQHQV